jgi:hypothetical protein
MAALSVQLHAEAVTRVEVHDIGNHSVSVVFGDDRSGVRLIGDFDDVAQLVAQAHALLRVAQSR